MIYAGCMSSGTISIPWTNTLTAAQGLDLLMYGQRLKKLKNNRNPIERYIAFR